MLNLTDKNRFYADYREGQAVTGQLELNASWLPLRLCVENLISRKDANNAKEKASKFTKKKPYKLIINSD